MYERYYNASHAHFECLKFVLVSNEIFDSKHVLYMHQNVYYECPKDILYWSWFVLLGCSELLLHNWTEYSLGELVIIGTM